MLSSAVSLMACLIFSQSISTFPVIAVTFLFSLFLYKVHMESFLNKRTSNLRGFLCFVLSLMQGDRKVSVRPMITLQSSDGQRLFDHPV